MSPFVRYVLLAIVAAALAFGVTYLALRPAATASLEELDELAWLKKEFRLTDAQLETIARLHDDYFPVCMDHCKRIVRARETLAAASPAAQPDAQAELARLEAVCRDATLAHLQRVAAVMPPEQGARFLALVGPKVSGQSHHAPLGLK